MIKNKGKIIKNTVNFILNNCKQKTQDQKSEVEYFYNWIYKQKVFNSGCKNYNGQYISGKFKRLNLVNAFQMSNTIIKLQKHHDLEYVNFNIHKKFDHILTLKQLFNQIQVWLISAQTVLNKQKTATKICSNQVNQVINNLILLIKLLQKHRLVIQNIDQNKKISSISMDYRQKREQLQKLIYKKSLQISNYTFKMLNFILGDYFNKHFESSKHEKRIQTLLIGTFLKQSLNFVSFKNVRQNNKQNFNQFHINQVLKMYLNSFQHIISDPIQHIFVYQVCQTLINIQKRLNLYQQKNESHYLSQRTQHIHEIQYIRDVSYKKIRKFIDPYLREIDNYVQNQKSFKSQYQIYLKLFSEYSRVFLFSSRLEQDQKGLLKLIQKTTFTLLESSKKSQKCKILNKSQFNQYFTFLMYFNVSYLIQLDFMISKQKQSQQLSQEITKLQGLKRSIINYMTQFYNQNQFLRELRQEQPKLNCLKFQIFNYIHLHARIQIYALDLKKQIMQLDFFNYPYNQLLWIHQQILKIIETKQHTKIISRRILQQLVWNPQNRISVRNNIWSLKNFVNRVNAQYQVHDLQQFNSMNSLICKWLCDHSVEDLLTQNQDDLSSIFQILNHEIYLPFFNKITALSLGKFKWESLNKLYFYSLNFFYIDTISHKLKQGVKEDDLLNVQYIRRYILNEYNAMGVNRRQIQTSSYFYKILQVQTPQRFYKNYFKRT